MKVSIIGAGGSVGSTTAYALLLQKVASEILLVDVDAARCRSQCLDLQDAAFVADTVVREATFQEAGQSDIVVVCAGAKQRPGEHRGALVARNKAIVAAVIASIQPLSLTAKLVLVSNPVDTITLIAQKLSGLPPSQVFGTGTLLDSMRLRATLSRELAVAGNDIHVNVLGEHGDSQFVNWSNATVGTLPLLDHPRMKALSLQNISEQVRTKAYEIIAAKGSTYFGIGMVVAFICQCIILNTKRIIPLSHYIADLGICLSLPCVLGANGITETIFPALDNSEKLALDESRLALVKMYSQSEETQ